MTRDSEFDITPIDYGDFSFSLNDSADSFRHFIEQEEAQEVVSPNKLRNGEILSSSTHGVNNNSSNSGRNHHKSHTKKHSIPSPHQTYYSSLPEKKSAVKESRHSKNVEKDQGGGKEHAPPVPPPPTRSSSKLFLQKYNTGVYGATPFQRGASQDRLNHIPQRGSSQDRGSNHAPTPPQRGSSQDRINHIPHQYRNNSHRRSHHSGTSDEEAMGGKTRPLSSSTPTLHHDEHNVSTGSSSGGDSQNGGKYQKGIGYNKLQRRKSLREEKPTKLPTNVDPERLRNFLQDPNHNVYLDDREFYQIFKITRERFYALPQTKKEEMKTEALKTFYLKAE